MTIGSDVWFRPMACRWREAVAHLEILLRDRPAMAPGSAGFIVRRQAASCSGRRPANSPGLFLSTGERGLSVEWFRAESDARLTQRCRLSPACFTMTAAWERRGGVRHQALSMHHESTRFPSDVRQLGCSR
jgi:hypothetical protein